MALHPNADYRLLPESRTQPRIVPALIIDHTQAGGGSLYNFWNAPGRGLECHFWVPLEGAIEQYMDTGVRADANYKANLWFEGSTAYGAISIETENTRAAVNAYYRGGDSQAFNRDKWSGEQMRNLRELHEWLYDTHPTIRRQRASGGQGRGLGYHSMLGTGPTLWIPYSSRGKECPGQARIKQWNDELLPAFLKKTPTPEGDYFDMGAISKEELQKMLDRSVNRAIAQIWIAEMERQNDHKETHKELEKVMGRLGSIRGWAASAAKKVHGSFRAAYNDAVAYDNAPGKKPKTD